MGFGFRTSLMPSAVWLVSAALVMSSCAVRLANKKFKGDPSLLASSLSSLDLSASPVVLQGTASSVSQFTLSGAASPEGAMVLFFVNDPTCNTAPAGVSLVTSGLVSQGVDTNQGAWGGDGAKVFYVKVLSGAAELLPCKELSSFSYTLDRTAPVMPTIALSPGSPSRLWPTFSGTAEAGSTLQIFKGAVCGAASPIATATAAQLAAGVQSSALSDGPYQFVGRITDAAGNVSGCSTIAASYVMDTVAPGVPTFSTITPVSPSSNNRPTVTGTAEAGSTVRLYSGANCSGPSVGSATAAGGNYSIQTSVLADGTHTIRATATDAAGNASACSGVLTSYVISTAGVSTPTITSVSPVSPTNNVRPTFIGTADPTSIVKIYSDASCTTLVAGGATGVDFAAGIQTPALGNPLTGGGTFQFYAQATNSAGTISSPCSSGTAAYVIDTTAPALPSLSSVTPATPSNSSRPTFTGTAEAGSTVRVYDGGTNCPGSAIVGTGTATGGNFSIQIAAGTPLSDGTHSIWLSSQDAAGNLSCYQAIPTFVVDTVAPSAPTLTATDPPTEGMGNPALIGSGVEATGVVRFYDNAACSGIAVGGGSPGPFTVAGVTVTQSLESTVTYYARFEDPAGNLSPCSTSSVTYFKGHPAPTVTAISPAVIRSDQDVSVTITGTGFYGTPTVQTANGYACVGVSVVSATQITCSFPSGNPTLGQNAIQVINPSPNSRSGSLASGPVFGSGSCYANPLPFAGGNGLPGSPFQINNLTQLQAAPSCSGAAFMLSASLDLSSLGGTNPSFFTQFTGIFDGQDYELSNFSRTSNDCGFFGNVSGSAVIRNLNIRKWSWDCGAAGSGFRGGLIATRLSGTATVGNVMISESSLSGDYQLGSVAGQVYGTSGTERVTIQGVNVRRGRVYSRRNAGQSAWSGGLVGVGYHFDVLDSTFAGEVRGNDWRTGGLIGMLEGGHNTVVNISRCAARVTLTSDLAANDSAAPTRSGGLVGYLSSDPGDVNITESYAHVAAFIWAGVGGLIGQIWSSSGGGLKLSLNRTYAAGLISNGQSTTTNGGLIAVSGGAGTVTVTGDRNVWEQTLSGAATTPAVSDSATLTSALTNSGAVPRSFITSGANCSSGYLCPPESYPKLMGEIASETVVGSRFIYDFGDKSSWNQTATTVGPFVTVNNVAFQRAGSVQTQNAGMQFDYSGSTPYAFVSPAVYQGIQVSSAANMPSVSIDTGVSLLGWHYLDPSGLGAGRIFNLFSLFNFNASRHIYVNLIDAETPSPKIQVMYMILGAPTLTCDAPAAQFLNQWVHIGVSVSSASRMRVYRNGELLNCFESGGAISPGSVEAFAETLLDYSSTEGDGAPAHQRLGRAAGFDRVLGGDEILDDYEASRSRFGL